MKTVLPSSIKKYFWGDDLNDLNWAKHKKYVLQTLLDKGDIKAIKWALDKAGKNTIKKMLPKLKLSEKTRNFWQTYLS